MTPTKKLAIVVPQHRFPLTDDEQTSLRQLQHFLGDFDKFLVHPQIDATPLPGFKRIKVNETAMASSWGYNRMLLDSVFYEFFQEYEYILVYQLDCLIFSDRVLPWCDKGWDYVGAPWFKDYGLDPSFGWYGVGNGGFSLRNVQSCLNVLNSPGAAEHIEQISKCSGMHEDLFWAWDAKKFLPSFVIPPAVEAVPFSFECNPEACFVRNNSQLPLGCHGWTAYGRDFWQPHLIKQDAQVCPES